MDPLSILPLAGACKSLSVRVAKAASAVEAFVNADRAVLSLGTTLRLFEVSLEQLQSWLGNAEAVVSNRLGSAVRSAIGDCETICGDLEAHIRRVRPTERRMSFSGRLRHLLSGDALAGQEDRLRRQLASVMLLASLVKLNDTDQQDSGIQSPEAQSILSRASSDAGSVSSSSSAGGSALGSARSSSSSSYNGSGDGLDLDDELGRSGPYVSLYRDIVSKQRGRQPSNQADSSSRTLVERFSPAKVSDEGRTMVAQLCQAARDKNVKWADHLLKSGAQVNGFCAWSSTTLAALDRHGNGGKQWISPLSCAAEAGAHTMVDFLLKRGADANDLDGDRGSDKRQKARIPGNPPMPLHWAVTKDSTAIADLLLQHGAVASATCTLEGVGNITPLHLAESAAMVTSLVAAGARVSATDSKGRTPLHYAETMAVAQGLIDNDGSVFVVDEEGQTPLFSAAMQFAQHYRVQTSPAKEKRSYTYLDYDDDYSAPARSWEEKPNSQPDTGKAQDFLEVMKANLDNDAPVNLRDKAGYTALARLIDCLRGDERSGTARLQARNTGAGQALLEKGAAEPEPEHPCHGGTGSSRNSSSALIRRTPRLDPQFVTAVITSRQGRALGRALGLGR